jgi:hypothetical protein
MSDSPAVETSSDPPGDGLPSLLDILSLPEAERALVIWMMKHGSQDFEAIRAFLQINADAAKQFIAAMQSKGFLKPQKTATGVQYLVMVSPKRPGQLPQQMWELLEE